jgi:hypothetical protein
MQRIALLILFAGCAAQSASTELAPPSLAQPVEIVVSQPAAASAVSFDVASWKQDSQTHLDLTPVDLRLVVRTGHFGEITGMEVPLADQDISAQALPPSGLKLRNLQLGLDGDVKVTTMAASDDYLALHAEAPLRLAWSTILADGSVYALGPAVTAPLAFDVQLQRESGLVTATIDARCDGDCWTIDGLARISNGQLHLVAAADLKPLD